MTTKPEPLEVPQVAPLVRQLAALDEELEDVQGRRNAVALALREILPTPGRYRAGDLGFSIRPGARRLDAKRFAAAYPPEDHPRFYKTSPDTTAARNALGQDTLDQFYGEPGSNSVVLG